MTVGARASTVEQTELALNYARIQQQSLGKASALAVETSFFSLLPVELVLTIIEFCAQNDHGTAISLSLVSRALRTHILPYLFGSITLLTRHISFQIALFLNANPHISKCVRSLYLYQSLPQDCELLVPCRGLERVALSPACLRAFSDRWNDKISKNRYRTAHRNRREKDRETNTSEAGTLPVLPFTTPREVMIFHGYLDWHDCATHFYTKTMLGNLTHLWLINGHHLDWLLRCTTATAALNSLSHLAAMVGVEMAPKVFDTFPHLQAFVCLDTSGESEPGICGYSTDCDRNSARRVFRIHIDRSKYIEDILDLWKEGEGSVWTRIEGCKVLKSCEELESTP